MLPKRIATALTVLNHQGVQEVARISLEKAAMWWRRGDPLELGKYVGRPSDIARLDGCRFGLDSPVVSDSLKYLLLSGKHEAAERSLISRFVDSDLPLVELGGAIGVVSCIANKRLKHPANHVVVEANPTLLALLTANRDLNGCQFTILHRAIAYGEPTVRFPLGADVLANSVCVPTDHSAPVATISLREILADRCFNRCTLICDIEGAEGELVRREALTLGKHVKTIIMEVHDRLLGSTERDNMFRTLQRVGFHVAARRWDTVALQNESRQTLSNSSAL